MALITCPACGREVSPRATACPGCGDPLTRGPRSSPAKAKGPTATGALFTVLIGVTGGLAIFLFLGFCCCGAAGDQSARERRAARPPEAVTAPARPALAPAPTPAPTPTVHRIGERFELGEYAYTVTEAKAAKWVGGEYFGKAPQEGATFVVVRFKIENLTSKTKTVLTDDFVLKDHRGREFRPSSEANTAIMLSGSDKDFIITEVQPGLSKPMKTAFEVPVDAVKFESTLIVPEKGLFRGGQASVSLPALK